MSMYISPPDDDLKAALISLKKANPTLGIAKTHALLLSTHPSWTVSEKRMRKILQGEGLVVRPSPGNSAYTSVDGRIYPSSRVIDKLDVGKWTTKVEVKYFDKVKGKGLVAKEGIAEGEVVWKEDPFIIAPEWEIFDLQKSSRACQYCTTPLRDSSFIIPCPASLSSAHCPARFCNRLCLSRSAKTHPLLCPARNPSSAPLVSFARKNEWLALHALSQCTARVLLSGQENDEGKALEKDWGVIRGFAELGMEERLKDTDLSGAEPDRATWKKAHNLFLQAFQEPISPSDKKRLERILKKPTRVDIVTDLFNYDAFLRGLGRMSLNLEAHGGLYTLHSHLNHSCTPNISVRHFDTSSALSRITVVARRAIYPGEELVITYVNPEAGLSERRRALRGWGFGKCTCTRCIEEGKGGGEVEQNGEEGDLERELRAGLGVM